MAERDLGYKRLFAHREMVADLLTGFVREPWVAEVELDTLERVNGSYVSDNAEVPGCRVGKYAEPGCSLVSVGDQPGS